jgi:hypothetical protein
MRAGHIQTHMQKRKSIIHSDLLLVRSLLARGRGILHLSIALGLLGILLGLLSSVFSLLLGFELGALLGSSLLVGLADGLALGLGLLLVALDDGSGDEANVVHLGDVDRLCGVLAVLVEPVLGIGLVCLTADMERRIGC